MPTGNHFDIPTLPEDGCDPRKRQQALVAMGRRAVAAPESTILVEDAAALLADVLGMEYWLVAIIGAAGEELTLQLSLGSPGGGDRKTILNRTSARGTPSLAAYALETGYPVTVDDLNRETRFQDTQLLGCGIRSAIAVPLRLSQRPFGVVAACSESPRALNADDLLFAETVAHLVTTTVARSQAEQALAEQQRLTTGLLETVDAIVMVLDRDGRIVHANRTCERLTGYTPGEIRMRRISDILPSVEQTDLYSSIFEQLRQARGPVRYESYLLTKHSERRRIAWSYDVLRKADGTIESILVTGIDVTQHREAEEQARQAVSPDGPNAPSPGNPRLETDPLAARPPLLNDERRRRQRRSYPYLQSIAPMLDGKLPEPAAFHQVQCNDISAGGFSYLASKPPQSDSVVAALGAPPSLTYLHAQIAHVTRIRRDGKWMYLVGCCYTGRVFY